MADELPKWSAFLCVVCLKRGITPSPRVKSLFRELPDAIDAIDAEHTALVVKEKQVRVDTLVSSIKKLRLQIHDEGKRSQNG